MKEVALSIALALAAGPAAAMPDWTGCVAPLVDGSFHLDFLPPVFHGPKDFPAVALSFDDGPSPYTPQVLAILKKYKVQATFFMVGEMVHAFPNWAQLVVADGHELGNHTYRHMNYCSGSMDANPGREAVFANEVERTDAELLSVAGVRTKLVRIPYGCHRAWIDRWAEKNGRRLIYWSEDGSDWSRPGERKLVEYYLSHAEPGAVILMHDGGGDRSETVEALDAILDGLAKKGLAVVTIGQMIQWNTAVEGAAR